MSSLRAVEKEGGCEVRRILSHGLLVFVVSGWFCYKRRQHLQSLGDGCFRAYDSWQWCDPVDE